MQALLMDWKRGVGGNGFEALGLSRWVGAGCVSRDEEEQGGWEEGLGSG